MGVWQCPICREKGVQGGFCPVHVLKFIYTVEPVKREFHITRFTAYWVKKVNPAKRRTLKRRLAS